MNKIAVIDYGMGNLHSVSKALEAVSELARVEVTSDPARILQADRVVFPGVGAIRDCMHEIRRLGFDEVVKEFAASGKPLLGVCVGMQAMLDFSEENGGVDCLGLFSGKVRFFGTNLEEHGQRLKVPHMGWNEVFQQAQHPLWKDIPDASRFYFVHSYYVATGASDQGGVDGKAVAGSCQYGVPFAAALHRDNIFAVQFHPEKSQHAGLTLLKNFVAWNGQS